MFTNLEFRQTARNGRKNPRRTPFRFIRTSGKPNTEIQTVPKNAKTQSLTTKTNNEDVGKNADVRLLRLLKEHLYLRHMDNHEITGIQRSIDDQAMLSFFGQLEGVCGGGSLRHAQRF